MTKAFFSLLFFGSFISYSCSNPSENKPKDSSKAKWVMVWNDEFSTDGLPDPQKWNYDVGGTGW
ncbi:MAG TPA: hypothetical protein VMT35_07050, partial [Ignavibacteriaceae bacterium]|nr:hypothetical protein [Ignavibacteriaceae bacterium]